MFGTAFYGNNLQAPRWMGDFSSRDHLEPWGAMVDATQFTDQSGVQVQLTASAAQNATSITVAALTTGLYPATSIITSGNVAIPSGSLLDFGGAKFARTTADALLGATTISVAALPTALAGTEIASYSPYPGLKSLPSGTIIGRTYAMRDAGTPFRAALVTDDEIFLTAFDAIDIVRNPNVALYRPGSVVKENYLPNYTALSTAAAEVQIATLSGIPTGGTFTITFNGAQTTPIAFNASAATVQTALQALPTIGASNATVAGSAGGPYTITFAAALAGTNVNSISIDDSLLTGGTPSSTVTATDGGTPMLTLLRTKYRCIKGKD